MCLHLHPGLPYGVFPSAAMPVDFHMYVECRLCFRNLPTLLSATPAMVWTGIKGQIVATKHSEGGGVAPHILYLDRGK